jgi:hypothetical protein
VTSPQLKANGRLRARNSEFQQCPSVRNAAAGVQRCRKAPVRAGASVSRFDNGPIRCARGARDLNAYIAVVHDLAAVRQDDAAAIDTSVIAVAN